MGVYAARREWLRDNRETGARFLQALLMAYDVLQKDYMVGIRTVAREIGLKEAWVKTMYENAPPPNIYLWADPQYRYSLAKGSALHRRLGYLATFLFEEKIIPEPVDLRGALDASVIAE